MAPSEGWRCATLRFQIFVFVIRDVVTILSISIPVLIFLNSTNTYGHYLGYQAGRRHLTGRRAVTWIKGSDHLFTRKKTQNEISN